MRKLPIDKKYFSISIYTLIVVLIAIIFEKALGSASIIQEFISGILGFILNILSPFMYGLLFAYLLNPLVKLFENNLLCKIKYIKDRRGITRPLSALMSYIIVIGCVVWIIIYLLPEIANSMRGLIESGRILVQQINESGSVYYNYNQNDLLVSLIDTFNEVFSTNYTVGTALSALLQPIMQVVSKVPDIISAIYSGALKFASGALDVFLGMIISFYMLSEKEKFSDLISKTLVVIFKPRIADKIIQTARNSNVMFEKFFVGKMIDSTIMGILFCIFCLIFDLRYTALLSIIMGVTNMIPYFGPFIGAIPIVLIVLITYPKMAIWTALSVFILQQIDGSIIGPKILGDSTGLKPMGVIFSILVGGALFGMMGMFFGVPIFAVISSAYIAFINRKYEKRMAANAKTDIHDEPSAV